MFSVDREKIRQHIADHFPTPFLKSSAWTLLMIALPYPSRSKDYEWALNECQTVLDEWKKSVQGTQK